MMNEKPSTSPVAPAIEPSRRGFIAGAAAATAATASTLPVELFAQVAGSDEIKVGMIGCGGRNSGAIIQNLTANDGARLVAVADAFQDKLDGSAARGKGLPAIQAQLEKEGKSKQFDVPSSRQYAGFDAYKAVIDQCDLVCIATPPGFRPIHFEYAVQAGKHVFMEKPVCVDAKGFNQVIEAAKIADQKNLKVVVGLQRHYQNVYLEAFKQVHEAGAIGEIVSAQAWWNGTRPWIIPREAGWSEMEYQMRNWYHFNWLCGDHIAEQHVHNIDVINWFVSGDSAMGGNPVIAQGMGGRAGTEPRTVGEIFDHHYVEFRFGPEHNNVYMNSQCRHQKGTMSKVAEEIVGTEGILQLGSGRITDHKGNVKWQYRTERGKADPNPYQVEHDELYRHIRENKPINNAYYGAKSSFTSVFGRLATYSGKEIKWDDAVKSNFSIMPENFAMDAEAPVKPGPNGEYAIAIPGEWPLPWG
ncbi:MAG: Gfo/Idh/MocA family oxidoreductase [Verrucomicrobiales bacterium]|nr:Gfo/Idh/MocA family oxidoreductase [Verrucomicrobiales bacterium]